MFLKRTYGAASATGGDSAANVPMQTRAQSAAAANAAQRRLSARIEMARVIASPAPVRSNMNRSQSRPRQPMKTLPKNL